MLDINGRAVMVSGTVLHRRDMYGPSMGGTYMVKYDNPTSTIRESLDHNAHGDDMVRIQQPKLKPEVEEPFKSGDRFQQEMFDINGRAVLVSGTVLHRRNMYGPSMGGTYMVKYDNPTPTISKSLDHNAYGDDMLRL